MNFSIVTKPTFDPVTLSEALAHCRVDNSDDDGLLVNYILAARQYLEDMCGLCFATQTIDATLDCEWPEVIQLPRAPAQSITSISYVDTAGATQVLASNQYVAALKRYVPTIAPAYGIAWPAVRDQTDAVTVRYVAGFGATPSDTPEALRQALLLLVGHWYENREAVVVGTSVVDMPKAVDALVAPYRRFY